MTHCSDIARLARLAAAWLAAMACRKLRSSAALVGCSVLLAVGSAALAQTPPDDDPELVKLNDQAIARYRAGEHKAAAETFLRVFRKTGAIRPIPLRNAAKSLQEGRMYEEALALWQKVYDLPSADGATRKEAYLRLRECQLVLGRQRLELADQSLLKKNYRRAGDAYVEAFDVAARQDPSYLRYAAQAYQAGDLFDAALVCWTRYRDSADTGAVGRQEAGRQIAVLQDRLDAAMLDMRGHKLCRAGKYGQAAATYRAAYGESKQFPYLRLAALAFERADDPANAAAAWREFAAGAELTAAAKAEAEDKLKDLHMATLKSAAEEATRKGQHIKAGDGWLELYTVSRDKAVKWLKLAAVAFESAEEFQRARSVWARLATAPELRDDEQAAASARAELLAGLRKGKRPPAVPAIANDLVEQDFAMPALGCGGCTALAVSSAVVMAAGVAALGYATTTSISLSDAMGRRDADGKVVGITPDQARAESELAGTARAVGLVALGAGVVGVTSAWLWERGSARRPIGIALAPAPGGLVATVAW